MELLHASLLLGDRYPKNPSQFYLSERDTDGNSPTQPRILVVDDERLLADTTAAILRRAGYNSKTAYDAFAALEAMASFHPDYLLTDVMMPGMNGVELAMAITKIHPETKILLFSGQTGISEILEDSKAKGFEFPLLAKPVHPTKLIEGLLDLNND